MCCIGSLTTFPSAMTVRRPRMLEHETPTLAAATSTTVRCPFCAEEIQQQAIYCRFCSRNVATGQAGQQPTKQSTGETTGLLMLAVPILATVLILFWIGNMNLLQAPASKLGLLAV